MAFFSKIFRAKQPKNEPRQDKTPAPAAAPANPDDIPAAQLPDWLLTVTDASVALQGLARLSTEQQRLPLAMQHSVAQVRLAAAEGIHDRDLLQQLQQQAKSKDKAVFRLCKERLAALRASEQEQQARQQRIEQLLAQARYLNKIGYHPEFNGKLQLLQKEWPELQADADAATVSAMQAELASASALLQQHADEEARRQAEAAARDAAAQQQQQIQQQLSQLLQDAAQADIETLKTQLPSLQEQWDNSLRQHKPELETGRQVEQQLQQLRNIVNSLQQYQSVAADLTSWLSQSHSDAASLAQQLQQGSQWLQNMSWPAGVAQPGWYQQLLQRMHELRGQEHQQQAQQKSRQQQATEQLTALEQALNNGQVKDAGKLNQQIQQQLKQLDQHSAAPLQRRLRALNTRLQEMRDWAGFATRPKKESLLEAMEALIGAELAPDLLADKIHTLQEEWKTLSGLAADHDLWERFQQAGDQAFEPCRAWFAEQAEQRQRFVQLRQQLIQELDHYEQALDWANADWKAVQKTLDTARDAFRTYGPVERHLHKSTQDDFNAVCDRIYGHLKQEYDRNLATKQGLVQQAEQLANSDDLRGAADQVKLLQAQWKAVGVTPRQPDQKLWQQFRKHCDAVFARMDEQREARKAELNEVVAQAEQQVAALLAELPDDANAARHAINDARRQLQDLNLPKSAQQRLLRQLQDSEQQHQQQQQAQQQQEQQQRRAGLFARLQHLRGDDAQWQQACALPLPDGIEAGWFEQARAQQPDNSASAADLCILMEILADQPSPDSAKARRMELQVQRLADGLGKGLDARQEMQQLLQRWLQVDADLQQQERFIQALEKLSV